MAELNIKELAEMVADTVLDKFEYEGQTIREWIEELKKSKVPMMVRYEGDGYADGEMVYDYAFCPNCDHEIEVDSENWGCMFCPECGQRLRWEE